MEHSRQPDRQAQKPSTPGAASRSAPPSAAQQAQARPAPPQAQHKPAVAPPPKATALPPRVEPAGQTAPVEYLTIAPNPAPGGDGTIEFDWEPAALGTNRSYSCMVTADPSHPLSVTLEQGMYRRAFDGQGVVKVSVIPPASASTHGSLTARDLTTGASAVFTWQWQPVTSGAGTPPPKPAGLLGRLFGRGKHATAVAAKAQAKANVATVAERLGARAPLAMSMKFFGQEAVGQRFAFILDRSGSMRGQRWSACTEQLARALRSMPEHAEFFVILFSSDAIEPSRQGGWTPARRDQIEEVISWVGTIWPGGGTDPTSAFKRVFSLPTEPDVIYFLTDGDVGDFTPESCAELRGSATTIINTIALENGASAEVLRETADASGGRFILIPDASTEHAHG